MCFVHLHTHAGNKAKHTPNKHPYFSLSLAQHTPSWSVPSGLSEPLAPPLLCSPLLYYPILQTLQTITGHKIAPTEAFLSPILLQGVGGASLSSRMPALLFQLSAHGMRLTSARLLKTVSADRHEERGVNALALKNLPTA